jgi:hypothetical protein
LTAMPAKLSTKTPDAPPNKPVENKFDPFRPEMPQIPGVTHGSHRTGGGSGSIDTQRLLRIGGIAAAVLLIGAVIFWRVKSNPRGARDSASSESEAGEQAVPPLPDPIATAHEGPTVAATVDELSKPWAAKKFTFVKSFSHENIDAIVIRLPGAELWAFSLQEPFGRCQLEFVTDLGRLASQYRYTASHPMVVNPCNGTVYDPLKIGPLEGNTWARGEIVRGSSLRPPISIDVKVSGASIIADSIE